MASVSEDVRERVAAEVAAPKLSGFWALIAAQFQGAFSDNTLKWLVSFLVLETAASKEERDLWFVLIVPLLFSVPFLLFSIPGGFLADKFSKRSVTIATVVGQLAVMALATWALAQGRLGWAGVALFLMSTLGAIFGPTKYGLLPELLPESKLSWGNGIIEFGTLLAAILAALAGINLPSKDSEIEETLAVLRSRQFTEDFIVRNNLAPQQNVVRLGVNSVRLENRSRSRRQFEDASHNSLIRPMSNHIRRRLAT